MPAARRRRAAAPGTKPRMSRCTPVSKISSHIAPVVRCVFARNSHRPLSGSMTRTPSHFAKNGQSIISPSINMTRSAIARDGSGEGIEAGVISMSIEDVLWQGPRIGYPHPNLYLIDLDQFVATSVFHFCAARSRKYAPVETESLTRIKLARRWNVGFERSAGVDLDQCRATPIPGNCDLLSTRCGKAVSANTMFRILALAAFVIGLALAGPHAGTPAQAAPVSGGEPVISAAVDVPGCGATEHHGHRGVHDHAHCCHAACSSASAFAPAGASLPGRHHGSNGIRPSGPSLTSLSLQRDPPIPRLPA